MLGRTLAPENGASVVQLRRQPAGTDREEYPPLGHQNRDFTKATLSSTSYCVYLARGTLLHR